MRKAIQFCLPGLAMLSPVVAHAHSLHEGTSFLGGFLHPLMGPDHLLAMLGVGIISVLIGGRAIFWVPGAFVAAMLFGGTLGVLGVALPYVELGIAMSVLLLGLGIAAPRQLPMLVSMAVVGLFGTLHGNAHGVEMPHAAAPAFYSLGFILSTAIIHLVGVGIGFIPMLHWKNRLPMRVAGVMITMTGIHFLVHLGA